MKRAMVLTLLAGTLIFGAVPGEAFDNLHGTHPLPKLNYDSLFQAAVPLDQSDAGVALIEQCIERYGGRDKLQSLKSLRLTYRMKAFLNRNSIDVTKYFQRGTQYKVVKRGVDLHEMRILNHEKAWFVSADTSVFLDSGRYKAELFSYLTLTMPLGMTTERFDQIRFGTRDADSLSYVYMLKNDTLLVVTGIDPRDGLIKSSEGVIYQGEGHFAFVNVFSAHREVDGYIIPHNLTNISMGLEVAHSVVTRADVNPDLDDHEFEPKDIINFRKVH